jgi:hypothetical protein
MRPPLFVFMTHGLFKLSVFMFPDLLSPFLHHTTHRSNLQSIYIRFKFCNKKRGIVKIYIKFT